MKKILALSFMLFSTIATSSDGAITRESLLSLDRGVIDRIKSDDLFGARGDIRDRAISDRGFQVGAQYGYIKRMDEIQLALESKSGELDSLYNFSYLMSMSSEGSAEMHLIPPTVEEYSDIKALDPDSGSLTIIENKYVITNPARLVTTPLDWRQYLTFTPKAEEIRIAGSLLPENSREKSLWVESVSDGWHEGTQMAEREMLSRIESLVRDYGGVIRFNRLADEGYFTRPELVETRVAVTGGGNELIQNKTVYTILADSSANINESDWRAIVLDNRESMIFPSKYSGVNIEVEAR